jgi:hypothetical protein
MGKRSTSILGADLAHLTDRVKAVIGAADVIPIDLTDARAGGISSSDDVITGADEAMSIREAA